ncbi:hypothetical protein K458DRAFT_418691 [Lentithecium fluviatile CBS 122367]|uniref:Protein kinase domain-containing protein n=1 Tax=Lentithecium fluviatile CBS 122367 TaxID=1168545 RepID=A0A6G1J0J1_9PLEO|nr:hypothetical protein K458DRAFT_418691 [Lentithecium fluviatile CBS 122367]
MAELIIGGISLALGVLGVAPCILLLDRTVKTFTGSIHNETLENVKNQMLMSVEKFEALKKIVGKHYTHHNPSDSNRGDAFAISTYVPMYTNIIQEFNTIWLQGMTSLETGKKKKNTRRLERVIEKLRQWDHHILFFQTYLLHDLPTDQLSTQGHAGDLRRIRQTSEEYIAQGRVRYEVGMLATLALAGPKNVPASKATYVIRDHHSIDIGLRRTDLKSSADRDKMAVVARALELVDPDTMGLPRCIGIATLRQPEHYEMIFRIGGTTDSAGNTQSVTPRSLRQLLSKDSEANPIDLTSRVLLAVQLVRSVFYLHITGIVHKNIRPENILIMDQDNASFPEKIGNPYLIGFEESRSEEQRMLSYRLDQDQGWLFDLYRSDNRTQIGKEMAEYKPLHDIYSLGILLMEIGFWEPLARWKLVEPSAMQAAKSQGFLEDFTRNDRFYHLSDRDTADKRKWRYLEVVEGTMPSTMGTRYTHVVKKCLRCLDNVSPNEGSGKRERILAEEILVELQNISV